MKGELDLESYRFTDQLVVLQPCSSFSFFTSHLQDKAKVHAAISTSRPLSSCGREGGAGNAGSTGCASLTSAPRRHQARGYQLAAATATSWVALSSFPSSSEAARPEGAAQTATESQAERSFSSRGPARSSSRFIFGTLIAELIAFPSSQGNATSCQP